VVLWADATRSSAGGRSQLFHGPVLDVRRIVYVLQTGATGVGAGGAYGHFLAGRGSLPARTWPGQFFFVYNLVHKTGAAHSVFSTVKARALPCKWSEFKRFRPDFSIFLINAFSVTGACYVELISYRSSQRRSAGQVLSLHT
jgi:hypothetical protein